MTDVVNAGEVREVLITVSVDLTTASVVREVLVSQAGTAPPVSAQQTAVSVIS